MNQQALTARELRELLQCERCARYFDDLVSVRVRLGVGACNTMQHDADLCGDCADACSVEAGQWVDGETIADGVARPWNGEGD